MELTDTETAVMVRQRDLVLEAAIHRLLHDLRQFMRAYPRTADTEMPNHAMAWVDFPDGNAGRVILDAIKANPALWAGALPSDVCIVPREALEKFTSKEHADYLAVMGGDMVLRHAARADPNARQPHSR